MYTSTETYTDTLTHSDGDTKGIINVGFGAMENINRLFVVYGKRVMP